MIKKCKICLHSTAGNEEKVILRMLNSCYKYIDYWVIQCNGSDSTKQIIEDFFKEKNIPGFTYQIEWNCHGYNRDHALQTLLKSNHGCDWILRMDADEQLIVEEDFDWSIFDDTSVQSWNVTADSPGSFYFRTWIWNAKLPWRFRHDKAHECILLPGCGETEEEFQRVCLPKSFRHLITNDGVTWSNPNKFLFDALILEKDQIANNILLKNNYHFFYIGKSYNDCYGSESLPLGYSHQKEYARRCIFYLEEYVNHMNVSTENEMVYYAQFLVGNAHKFCKEYDKAILAYKKCDKLSQLRNEHLCGLAEVSMEKEDFESMYMYTSILMNPSRKNPFPNACFLLHNSAYYDTGNYVQSLHSIAKEGLNSSSAEVQGVEVNS